MVEGATLETATRQGYGATIGKHIRPLLGKLSLGQLDGRVFDSFYAELRRCRDHCAGKPVTATARGNENNKPHTCRPLGAATILTVVVIDDDVFETVFPKAVTVNDEGEIVGTNAGKAADGVPFTGEAVDRMLTIRADGVTGRCLPSPRVATPNHLL